MLRNADISARSAIFSSKSKTINESIRRSLWNEVRKYRKDVLFNAEARKKARIAAAISYMGYKTLAFAYKKTQWRG